MGALCLVQHILFFRYPKTIAFAIKHFKEYSLDALYIVTNAPGRRAFNRVERRMAPLSNQLSGLILPHDAYGSHLDSRNRCIDPDLERKNFAKAGETLAEVWNQLIIDDYKVFSEYITSAQDPDIPAPTDPLWYSKHVRESQYFLQVLFRNIAHLINLIIFKS